jgi:hypothetical protein
MKLYLHKQARLPARFFLEGVGRKHSHMFVRMQQEVSMT